MSRLRIKTDRCQPAFKAEVLPLTTTRVSPGIVFMVAVLLLAISALQAEPNIEDLKTIPTPQPRKQLKTHRIFIMPLENESGEKKYDYLTTSIASIIGDRLQNFGYIYRDTRENNFKILPNESRRRNPLRRERFRLKVEKVEYNNENYKVIKTFTALRLTQFFEADYTIRGRLTGASSGGGMALELELFDIHTGESNRITHRFNPERRPLQQLERPTEQLLEHISLRSPALFRVESDVVGAMVYLDDFYLGRTPLTAQIIPGRYLLRVEKRGRIPYQKDVTITGGTSLNIKTEPLQQRSKLTIASEPEGAGVYLNERYLGETPLERSDLPEGVHRLRIRKEGYIDRFMGVKLSESQAQALKVDLEEGDSRTHFLDPGYALLDWTFFDLSFYNLFSTLMFYGGYGYFSIRADEIHNSLRNQVPLILYLNETNLLLNRLSSLSSYHLYTLQQNRKESARMEKRARISGQLGIFSFVMAALFLYLDLNRENEVGEQSAQKERDEGRIRFFAAERMQSEGDGRLESSLLMGWQLKF